MKRVPLDDTPLIQSAFAAFPSGVAAITAMVDGAPVGLVSTSFTVGVSFDPPQVLFSVQNSSRTWPVLRTATRLGISVLARGHEDACMQLASRSRDRFAGLALETTPQGAIFLHDAVMWLDCEMEAEIAAGDHHIIVLAVRELSTADAAEPLVYHGREFRALERAIVAAA
jgi:flavin reductase (DIM6/NTAB) family NADH-FMN oxidoreductase RutF